jgi:outer membrane protein assembly factor BamB
MDKLLRMPRTIMAVVLLAFAGHAWCAPSQFLTGLTVHKPDKVQPGITLYCIRGLNKIFALDQQGNEIHTWTLPGISANVKALPKGHVLLFANSGGDRLNLDSDVLREYDWDGQLVWEFPLPEGFLSFHHDFQRLQNGNTLILGAKLRTTGSIPREVRDNIILEVDSEKNIVWQWSVLDHFEQLGLSEDAKNIIVNQMDGKDIFHTNSMQALPPNRFEREDGRFRRGNLLISQRNTNLVFIIDRTTGDIVWRSEKDTIGQHHASMIPPNFIGSGNLILFDNGGYGGYPTVYRLYSRISEFNPVTGKKAWNYTGFSSDQRPAISFFSVYRGGVQRLRNGNTLITEADWGRIFEVTKNGEIVWEYICPYFRYLEGNLSNGYTNLIYRAYRVAPDWQTGNAQVSYW